MNRIETRIRKNAAKKIAAFLEAATEITIETHSMGMDDCMNSNGDSVITAEQFTEWFDDHYADMQITEIKRDGVVTSVTFRDGQWHWCDTVVMTFQPVDEIKKREEEAKAKEEAERRAELAEATKELTATYAMITDEVTRRRSVMMAKTKAEMKCAEFDVELNTAQAKRIERNILLSIIAEIIVNDDQAEEAEKEAVEAPQKPRILVGSAEYYQWLETADKAAEAAKIDGDKTIESIEVLWSESPVFSRICSEENEKRLISLSTYNKLYALAMMDADPEGGYFKTKCNITTKSGEFATFRHDIGHRDGTLADDWSSWVDYCRAEAEKRGATKH